MSDSSCQTIIVSRNPEWAGGKFHMEYRDEKGNIYASSGMSFNELIKILELHYDISHTSKKPFPRDEDWEEGITN